MVKVRDILVVALTVGVIAYLMVKTGVADQINPFVWKLRVTITTGVDCLLGFCWWNKKLLLDYEPYRVGMVLVPRKLLAWWCGPLKPPTPPITATLRVTAPDGTVWEERKETASCEPGDIEFKFSVPLELPGTYDIEAEVCGEPRLLPRTCVTKKEIFTWGG